MNENEREKTGASSSVIKGYLIRGAIYLVLLCVCGMPFASAKRLAPASSSRKDMPSTAIPKVRPTPTPRSRPTPAPRPIPPLNPLDTSVTWQNNTVHDGYNPASHLVTPLTLKWSRDFSASGVDTISYPLIAGGMVFVTTANTNGNYGNTLWALDENTGMTIWSTGLPGTY